MAYTNLIQAKEAAVIQRTLHTEIIAMAMLLRFLPRSDVTRLELGNPLCQVEALREALDDQE